MPPKLIERAQCGIVVPAGDARQMAEAVRRLARDGATARQLGLNGRSYAEQHLSRPALHPTDRGSPAVVDGEKVIWRSLVPVLCATLSNACTRRSLDQLGTMGSVVYTVGDRTSRMFLDPLTITKIPIWYQQFLSGLAM